MPSASKSRRKSLKKISLDELMGAAGMSGFAAVIDRIGRADSSRDLSGSTSFAPAGNSGPVSERFPDLSLRTARWFATIDQQNQILGSLRSTLARRQAALERVLRLIEHRHAAAHGKQAREQPGSGPAKDPQTLLHAQYCPIPKAADRPCFS
ncbi:MAG TPA: hypothetical protein VLX58_11260 [Bryobacteraceae bacterium]|nr:hypothetical protein [Bryobacteraceae bacterium]